ncbi:AAA family ATPase [Actinoplanes sp. NPDC049118]|uniref:ATP-dependent nuclease n=1 Tax=Actinoplanes sp. NPDC049118 TaxID=3155769 RepID=UPI0033E64DCD
MRIGRLAIKNFRNFLDLEIAPFPVNAVFVGENGIGKSNLLYALRLVLDPDLPRRAQYLREEDICEYGGQRLADGVEVRIEVDLVDIDQSLQEDAACDGCFVSLDPLTARLTYVFRPRAGADVEGELGTDHYEVRVFGGDSESDVPRIFTDDVSLTVLPALRDAVNELSRWRSSPLQELLEARPPASYALKTAAEAVQDAMTTLAKDDQITAVAADIDRRLDEMAGPRLQVTPTLGFASSVPERLMRSIRLYVDIDRRRTVGETSTGNANVIYLSLLLERLASRRDRDLIVTALLAVEEPEAHLHPVLQRQLFRYLLRNDTQLLVTTHSPHIAAVTNLPSLIVLRPGEQGATVAACAGAANLTVLEVNDLERYLDANRAELLFCSAAILVEGPSETYLIPAISAALGFDLDAYGVVVANISGTNFGPYRRLLDDSALSVPHVIITDGDPYVGDKYTAAGLRRAAKLIDEAALEDMVEEVVVGMGAVDSTPARCRAAGHGVFVGQDTLEPDLAPLFAEQMVAAHGELEPSSGLHNSFVAAVTAVSVGAGAGGPRQELLRRITSVSKGRYAQRLASHVQHWDGRGLGAEVGLSDDVIRELDDVSSSTLLLAAGTYGYILAALDRISWTVRGHGILQAATLAGTGA